jgi:hypothetical protein
MDKIDPPGSHRQSRPVPPMHRVKMYDSACLSMLQAISFNDISLCLTLFPTFGAHRIGQP